MTSSGFVLGGLYSYKFYMNIKLEMSRHLESQRFTVWDMKKLAWGIIKVHMPDIRHRNVSLLLVATLPLSACTSAVLDRGKIDVHESIDVSIQGYERDIMANVMNHLPEKHRTNVIYIDRKGKVHSNREALKTEFKPAKQISKNLWQKESGEMFVLPEEKASTSDINAQVAYTCSPAGGGTFRRVATQQGLALTNQRFSYIAADVFAPGSGLVRSANFAWLGQVTTPFIYLGGRSTEDYAGASAEVDAGLQWGESNQDWAIFIRRTLTRVAPGSNPTQVFSGPRLYSPAFVTMTFYVPTDGLVALNVSGGTLRTYGDRTIVADAVNFTKSGVGNYLRGCLKRLLDDKIAHDSQRE